MAHKLANLINSMHSKCRYIMHIAGLSKSIKKGGGRGTRKAFIASCKTKPLKWEHCLEVRLKMCEEALSNQVKREKKKSFVRNRRK